MIAISTDDADTSRRFKASLKAPYSFVGDEKAALTKIYDVKMPVLTIANRTTFVVGAGRKILAKQEGSEAIDPSGSVAACSLKAPESLKFITGDAGRP